MTLRVGFDVTPLINGRTGIARYLAELTTAIRARHGDDVELRRFAVGRGELPAPADVRRFHPPLRIVRMAWSTVGLPRVEHLVGSVDIVHAGALVLPPTRRPLLIMVHDIAPLERPDLHTARQVAQVRTQIDVARRRATVVCTNSRATADTLVDRGVDENRVIVTLLGVAPLADPERSGFSSGSYVLAVGETAPRKDYATLMRAFARLSAPDGAAPGLQLVHAGPPASADGELRRLVADLDLADRVHLLGPISDARLAGLYQDAVALCVTSVVEGYGLPVAEAMAASLPVVASDLPALREVAGDAARFASIGDVDAFVRELSVVIDDVDVRAHLIDAGRRRAAGLTWAATADATVAAYRRAMELGPR